MSTSKTGAETTTPRQVDCVTSKSGSEHIVRKRSLGDADTSVTLCGNIVSRENLPEHITTVQTDALPDNMCEVCEQSLTSE